MFFFITVGWIGAPGSGRYLPSELHQVDRCYSERIISGGKRADFRDSGRLNHFGYFIFGLLWSI